MLQFPGRAASSPQWGGRDGRMGEEGMAGEGQETVLQWLAGG